MKLPKDLREFIALLNSKNVEYLLVGGHAVAYHGYPRFTGDVDFFISRTATNAAALVEVLAEFGFSELGLKVEDFLEPNQVIQLGRPPARIDLLTSIEGVEFDEAWQTRVPADLDGLPVSVISKDLLIRNKKSVNRAQDQADLEKLQ